MSSFFQDAHHMNFSGHNTFTSARKVVNIHCNHPAIPRSESGVTTRVPWDKEKGLILCHAEKQGFRSINIGDIIVEREISSNLLDISIKRTTGRVLKNTNPFRDRINQATASFKIRRRRQIAEIIRFRDQKFTVVTFEQAEDGTDAESLEAVWKWIYKTSSSRRCEMLPQLFGLGRSSTPILIFHDAFLVEDAIYDQFDKMPIVWSYLWYKLQCACSAVMNDSDIRVLIKDRLIDSREWVLNTRNHSWQYDFTSAIAQHESYAGLEDHRSRDYSCSISQLQHVNLPLESKAIIDRLQQDFVRLIASLGVMMPPVRGQLKDSTCHNLLTFGAIIDLEKPGLFAHFPSVPSPEWYAQKYPYGVKVTFSPSVPGRVDLGFDEGGDTLRLGLGLRIPRNNREKFRLAYLSQSLGLFRKAGCAKHTWRNLLYMDDLRFILTGIFTSNLKQTYLATQVHLFITPAFSISIKQRNGIPCLQLPLITPLYYWSSDPEGKIQIPEEDWEQYGVPKLETQVYLGTFWDENDYESVQEYLTIQGYDSFSDKYARIQGYEILNQWDPHTHTQVQKEEEDWIQLEGNEQIRTERDPNYIMSSSMYSLISQSEAQNDELVLNEAMVSSRSGKFLSWLPRGWLNRGHSTMHTIKDELNQTTVFY